MSIFFPFVWAKLYQSDRLKKTPTPTMNMFQPYLFMTLGNCEHIIKKQKDASQMQ